MGRMLIHIDSTVPDALTMPGYHEITKKQGSMISLGEEIPVAPDIEPRLMKFEGTLGDLVRMGESLACHTLGYDLLIDANTPAPLCGKNCYDQRNLVDFYGLSFVPVK